MDQNRKKKLSLVCILFAVVLGIGVLVYNNVHQTPYLHDTQTSERLGASPLRKWKSFSSLFNHFSILFPVEPTVTSYAIPLPETEDNLVCQKYRAKREGEVYSVAHTALLEDWTKFAPPFILKQALRLMQKQHDHMTLLGSGLTTFKGFPALDYRYHSAHREIAGTFVLVENVLYQVEVGYPTRAKRRAMESFQPFLDSFTIFSEDRKEISL